MSTDAVRDAYSECSGQYIRLFNGDWPDTPEDTALIRHHLVGLDGPVFDLGCGPGHWTADLHSRGVDIVGVDMVPEFISHARATHRGVRFQLGSMMDLEATDRSIAGILAWYSTIHFPPTDIDQVFRRFQRILQPGGVLVMGFFDSENDVTAFDHAVATAYRWPVEVLVDKLSNTGFVEVEHLRHQTPERPDRRYATVVARRSCPINDGSLRAPHAFPPGSAVPR